MIIDGHQYAISDLQKDYDHKIEKVIEEKRKLQSNVVELEVTIFLNIIFF